MEYQINKINFHVFSSVWRHREGGIDVGGSMLKKECCFEGVHAPPTPKKLEN